jgi:hypothetical protein
MLHYCIEKDRYDEILENKEVREKEVLLKNKNGLYYYIEENFSKLDLKITDMSVIKVDGIESIQAMRISIPLDTTDFYFDTEFFTKLYKSLKKEKSENENLNECLSRKLSNFLRSLTNDTKC